MFLGKALNSSMNERALSIAPALRAPPGAELRHVLLEQVRHLDDRRLVLAVGLDLEGADDGRQVRGLDRLGDGVGGIGAYPVADVAQQHLVAVQFPAHDPIPHRHAGIRTARRGFRNLDHPEQVRVESVGRYFVVETVLDAMHPEQPHFRGGILGDHFVVFLDLRFLGRGFLGLLFAFLGAVRFGAVRRFVLGEIGGAGDEQAGQQPAAKKTALAKMQMHGPTPRAPPSGFQDKTAGEYSVSR